MASTPLIVETGTGVSGANTYSSMASVQDYIVNRVGYSFSSSSPSTDSYNQAILRGMNYIEQKNWLGIKYNSYNPLEWPRGNVIDRNGYGIESTEIPQNLKYAVAEAAYREIEDSGSLQEDLARGGKIKSKKIGPLNTEWFESASAHTTFTVIDGLLKGLVQSTGSSEISRS